MEISQTAGPTPAPPAESTLAPSPTSLFPTTPIPVTWSHLNLAGKLLYISITRENDIYTNTIQLLDLATGDLATILSIPDAWIFYATVSPDAKWLVMSLIPASQSNLPPNRNLYIMPLDATAPPQPLLTPSTPDDHYVQAEWSPDGEYLYFVHYNSNIRPQGQLDPHYNILRMRYPDGQPEMIAEPAFWPRISSDSTRLVYVSIDPVSGRNDLYIANADGTDPQKIAISGASIPEIIDAPIFSPDGASILFSAPPPAQAYQPDWLKKLMGPKVVRAHDVLSDWWSVPVTGGAPTQLTNIQTNNLFASISPDEERIVSLSGEGIFVMALDGSGLTRLVSDPEVHGTVTWIP